MEEGWELWRSRKASSRAGNADVEVRPVGLAMTESQNELGRGRDFSPTVHMEIRAFSDCTCGRCQNA